jgi:hypothetical protein
VYADAKYTNAIPARINPNPNFKRIDIFVYLDDTSYKPYAKLEDTGKQELHVGQIKKSNKINNADTEDFKYNVDMLQGDEVDDDPQPSGSRYKTKSKAAKTLAAKLSARAPTEAEEIAPLGYSATLAANTRQTRSRMKEPSTTIENSSRQLRSRSRSKTPATPVKNGRNDHPLDESRLFQLYLICLFILMQLHKRQNARN